MKVISTNVSEKRTITIGGEVLETGMYKIPVQEGVFIGEKSVENDVVIDRRFHGGPDKACYLYGKNNYKYFENLYPNATWEIGMFGENITLDEVDESNLNIGDVYQIGEAQIQIAQPRIPCNKFGYRLGSPLAIKTFAQSDYPGIYVRVLKPGKVKVGDEMVLLKPAKEQLSLVQLFRVLTNKSAHTDKFKSIVANPNVPDRCKTKLRK